MTRIAMYVFNDARNDARVLREAASLVAAGHTVTILARAADDRPAGEREVRDGVAIVRVPVPARSRLAWQWLRAPWTLRRPWLAALGTALRRRPPSADSVVTIVGLAILAVLTLPWLAIRLPIHLVLGRRRPSAGRSNLDWLAWWWLVVLGWARAAADAAPPSDVQHGHDLTGLEAAGRAWRRRGGRLVYDSHEIFVEAASTATRPRILKAMLERSERRWARAATAVVTVNPMIGAELERRMPVRRLVIVHNCPPRWEPPARPANLIRAATGMPAGAPLLLYHGGFSAHRGLEQLAESILEPGLEAAHAVYLGYGSQRPLLDALVGEARFGGRLHVLDAVDPDVLLDWVAGADVGVIPGQPSTLNHLLSSPNKLFEALAAGVPVAIMDFPYVHRIVLDDPAGPLGTVCDPADPASIAAAVRAILDLPPADRAALRARCLAAAHERWNWETESARLVALYADLEAAQAGASTGSAMNRGTGTAQSS